MAGGKKARDKGAGGELEVLAFLPQARKLSGMYVSGPDGMWRKRFYEVKRYAEIAVRFYRWLEDDSSLLFVRGDRKPWLVVMYAETTLLDLLDEAYENGKRARD